MTGVSDKGLKHLAGAKQLQQLVLYGNRVTATGVAELKKVLPRLQIDSKR
jgi:hypothetical protein